jgi:hypothetical protein
MRHRPTATFILLAVLLLSASACASGAESSRGATVGRAPHPPRMSVPSAETAQAEASPHAPQIAPSPIAPPQSLEARLATADDRLAIVRNAHHWPSEEDHERWRRDLSVAESARERFEAARGTPDESAAFADYEGAATIAFANRRAIELGALSRERP